MKHFRRNGEGYLFLVVLILWIIGSSDMALAADVSLPKALHGVTLEEEDVRALPSPDGTVYLVSVRVMAGENTSVYEPFEATLWAKQVDLTSFLEDPTEGQASKQEYASVFCNLNRESFGLACASEVELEVVDNSHPWWVPIATVPKNQLSETIAELTRATVVPMSPEVIETPAPVVPKPRPPAPPAIYQNALLW
jgi:hypothetical protein